MDIKNIGTPVPTSNSNPTTPNNPQKAPSPVSQLISALIVVAVIIGAFFFLKGDITKSEFNILSSLKGVMKYLSDIAVFDNGEEISGIIITEGEVQFAVEDDDLSRFKNEFYYNIVDDGMDREGQVNEYGKQLYDIYDKILYQTKRHK